MGNSQSWPLRSSPTGKTTVSSGTFGGERGQCWWYARQSQLHALPGSYAQGESTQLGSPGGALTGPGAGGSQQDNWIIKCASAGEPHIRLLATLVQGKVSGGREPLWAPCVNPLNLTWHHKGS